MRVTGEVMVNTKSELNETITFLGTDQPETCRKCGARTDFLEFTREIQLHLCLLCSNRYFVEFDDDDYQRTYEN
jgi:hypothetical protein